MTPWGNTRPVAVNMTAPDIEHVDLQLADRDRWQIAFASDWSGYHGAGSNLAILVDGGCALSGYGAIVAVPVG